MVQLILTVESPCGKGGPPLPFSHCLLESCRPSPGLRSFSKLPLTTHSHPGLGSMSTSAHRFVSFERESHVPLSGCPLCIAEAALKHWTFLLSVSSAELTGLHQEAQLNPKCSSGQSVWVIGTQGVRHVFKSHCGGLSRGHSPFSLLEAT